MTPNIRSKYAISYLLDFLLLFETASEQGLLEIPLVGGFHELFISFLPLIKLHTLTVRLWLSSVLRFLEENIDVSTWTSRNFSRRDATA